MHESQQGERWRDASLLRDIIGCYELRDGARLGFVHATKLCIFVASFNDGLQVLLFSETNTNEMSIYGTYCSIAEAWANGN